MDVFDEYKNRKQNINWLISFSILSFCNSILLILILYLRIISVWAYIILNLLEYYQNWNNSVIKVIINPAQPLPGW